MFAGSFEGEIDAAFYEGGFLGGEGGGEEGKGAEVDGGHEGWEKIG